MAQKKGQTGNLQGRPKGKPNKSTTEMRNLFNELLSSNLDNIQADLDKLEPKDRITILLKLSEFVLPKLQSTQMPKDTNLTTTIKIGYGNSLDALTDDELRSLEAMQKKVGYKPPTTIQWGNQSIEI